MNIMRGVTTTLTGTNRVGPFSFFTDEALQALAPAIDTFAPDVVARRAPQTSLVHEYNCEVGHRRARSELAAKRAGGTPSPSEINCEQAGEPFISIHQQPR